MEGRREGGKIGGRREEGWEGGRWDRWEREDNLC